MRGTWPKSRLARWPGWALCWGCLALSGCRSAVDPTVYTTFQAAQQAFDAAESPADFLRAAALYQQIRDQGVVSGIVLYNQGNAYMRAGKRGHAIACYRQAQRYRPRDPFLQANLRFALAGQDPRAARRAVLAYLFFWQDWISYPGKFHLSAWLAGLTFLAGLAGLRFRRLLAWVPLPALVTLIVLLSGLYDWYRFDHQRHGVVVQHEVVARKGNASSYEPVFTTPLNEATEFQLVEQRGDWLRIRLAVNQEGWIPATAAVVY